MSRSWRLHVATTSLETQPLKAFWHRDLASHRHQPFRRFVAGWEERERTKLPHFFLDADSFSTADPARVQLVEILASFQPRHAFVAMTPDGQRHLPNARLESVRYSDPHPSSIVSKLTEFSVYVGESICGALYSSLDESYFRHRISKDLTGDEIDRLRGMAMHLSAAQAVGAHAFVTHDPLIIRLANQMSNAFKVWIVTVDQALDFLETRMKERNTFVFNANTFTDRSTYYECRVEDQISNFSHAWRHVVEDSGAHAIRVLSYLTSIQTRMKYLAEARDYIARRYYDTASSDANDAVVYHFNHFVLLTTGLLDNLAWILLYMYHAQPEILAREPNKIGLGRSRFRSSLLPGAQDSIKLISSHLSFIDLIESMRQSAAHRTIAWPIGFDEPESDSGFNLIELDVDVGQKLRSRLKDSGPFNSKGLVKVGETFLLEPYRFMSYCIWTMADITNGILGAIWPRTSAHPRLGVRDSFPQFTIPFRRDFT